MDFIAWLAGVRCTTVPPETVTVLAAGEVPLFPELMAEATNPVTTMNTAIPSTMRAGPRADTGW
jgi:hypothetical protein